MLFTDEVTNIQELLNKINELNIDIEDGIKVAVVCFIFDSEGKLILQRRGKGARDDVDKLCAIGGSANMSDANFRESLLREIREEGGTEAEVQIDKFIGAIHKKGFDKNSGTFNDWIILSYMGTLKSGEFINTEPERCSGFERKFMEEYDRDELVLTAKVCIDYLLK